ncbi:hypothetical protein [Spirosoma rhododendri]|uniref:Uncharacterized protein n=1 Tax=Spirosoma rhododendri TaxID=2728024 RepID=A0A7L5DT46_9BACT|nr:hypothetical protein [Spirosoma rhododendri]QJD78720.1 hypothetical protein HH216_09980 [Spirosoma rhododendri]
MKGQEQSASITYEAAAVEVQGLIMDWVEATEQFHNRYARLTEVINSLRAGSRRQDTATRMRLRQLMSLRQHMSDVLMTLLMDMNNPKADKFQSSKPGQLHSHARLLTDLNREIDAELTGSLSMPRTIAQA